MAGAKIQKLVRLLNESIPTHRGHAIRWTEEELYPARGAWKKKSMDVFAWQAYGAYVEGGGVLHVGSYATVTELIKYKKLELIGGDEVYGVEEIMNFEVFNTLAELGQRLIDLDGEALEVICERRNGIYTLKWKSR